MKLLDTHVDLQTCFRCAEFFHVSNFYFLFCLDLLCLFTSLVEKQLTAINIPQAFTLVIQFPFNTGLHLVLIVSSKLRISIHHTVLVEICRISAAKPVKSDFAQSTSAVG